MSESITKQYRLVKLNTFFKMNVNRRNKVILTYLFHKAFNAYTKGNIKLKSNEINESIRFERQLNGISLGVVIGWLLSLRDRQSLISNSLRTKLILFRYKKVSQCQAAVLSPKGYHN